MTYFYEDDRIKKINAKPEVYIISLPQRNEYIFLDVFFNLGKIFEGGKIKNGTSHIFEHCAVAQTRKKIGSSATVNGWVNDERLSFYIESKKNNFWVDTSTFLSSIFSPSQSFKDIFNCEQKSIENELNEENNNIKRKIFDGVVKEIFKNNFPYARSIIEDIKSVGRVVEEDINSFLKNRILRSKPIFFVGKYKPDNKFEIKVNDLIKKFSSELRDKKKEKLKYPKCVHNSGIFKFIHFPLFSSQNVYSVFIFPGMSFETDKLKERFGLNMILNTLVGFSPFGLATPLRKIGIYNLDYENFIGKKIGTLGIFIYSFPNQIFDFATLFISVIEKIKNGFITDEFIKEMIKNNERYQKEILLDNVDIYNRIVSGVLDEEKIISESVRGKILASINSKFLSKLAKRIFKWNNVNFLIFGHKNVDSDKIVANIKEIILKLNE